VDLAEVTEQKGLPIYLDQINRQFADSASEKLEITDWHPSNTSAIHLWRCFEALKDIANLLQGTAILTSEQEKRRRIKILVTPLYSLCVAIRDLCNYLSSSSELKSQMGKQKKAEINQWLNDLLAIVPLDKSSSIRGVRDQLSAHIDKLMPIEAQKIFAKVQNHEIGAWLDQCIAILDKLLSLNVFGWTTDDCPEGYVRFMMVEPWLVTFKLEDGEPVAIVGLHIADSPKNLIGKTLEEVVETSQWMFRSEDPRMGLSQLESGDSSTKSNNSNAGDG
jgi:hypothetical protein